MPWKRPTTTPVPDELFDQWLPDLSEGELKVLLYIMRHTLGFKKDADAISFKQFLEGIRRRDGTVVDKGALRSRPALVRALAGLEAKQLVRVRRTSAADGGTGTTVYELWWEGGASRLPPQLLSDQGAVARGNRGPVAGGHPQETTSQQTTKAARTHPARARENGGAAGAGKHAGYTGGRYGVCAECGARPCCCLRD